MIKNKFCLVGVDRDLDSLINKHRSKFVGYFSNFNSKKYFNSGKSIGKENLKDWLKIKKNLIQMFILLSIMVKKEKN